MAIKDKSIVILDQASGYLQIDILEAYQKEYTHQAIVAGTIRERRKKVPESVVWEKVIKYDQSTAVKRIWTWGICTLQMLYLVLTKYRKSDLLIITNPPTATFIPLLTGNTYDILVYDLYPDALEEYGYVSSKSLIYRFWTRANRKVLANARKIITLSEGMRKKVSKYAGNRPIDVVPIWTDNSFLKPIPKAQNPFVEQWGLEDKFVIMYSGNLGKTHPVEVLFYLAQELQDQRELFFLIIGGGHKFKKLKSLIDQSALKNIRLLEWQPVESIPYTLNVGNIGVVTLDANASNLSVPSKTFDLMSIGVPILAIASEESELSRLLYKHQAGACFPQEQLEKIKAFILALHQNETEYNRLAENSLQASNEYTAKNAEAFLSS